MRTVTFLCTFLATLTAIPNIASASIQQGDLVKFSNSVGSPGGAFFVDNLSEAGSPNFTTFCVEITEHINFSSTYVVESLGQSNSNGKPLSSITAWLYNSYLDGTLNSFNYASASDNNALQLAIWFGMGYVEQDIIDYIGQNFLNTYNPVLAAKPWDVSDMNAAGWSGTGYVEVIRIEGYNGSGRTAGEPAQDQLVRNTPEPLSAVVWSLLAVCFGGWVRRR